MPVQYVKRNTAYYEKVSFVRPVKYIKRNTAYYYEEVPIHIQDGDTNNTLCGIHLIFPWEMKSPLNCLGQDLTCLNCKKRMEAYVQ